MIQRVVMIVSCWLIATLAFAADYPTFEIAKTVIKKPITKGVSFDEAIDSMKLRANNLNLKLVAHQPLSKEYQALGLSNIKRTEIFQFCDAKIAKEMIEHDISYAAYMPCRITLVEDKSGQGWLVMMNLDIFISNAKLPPRLHQLATKMRDNLMSVIEAGASGDL
jgi:uncharacterized protein (DUF302 family)